MSDTLEFYGPNAGYVQELYERYLQDPASVDAETRAIFDNGFAPPTTTAYSTNGAGAVPPVSVGAPPTPPDVAVGVGPPAEVTRIVPAARLGRIVRELGHLDARIDPLSSPPPSDPSLKLETHHLTTNDLMALPARVIGGPLAQG